MNLQQINQLKFETVLQNKLGIEPTIRKGNSLFYISPFRFNERKASFHVTEHSPYDLFYDHGNGIGGKIVDFFIEFLKTNPKGVLEYFNGDSFFFQKQNVIDGKIEKNYEILTLKTIESFPLIQYLESQSIPLYVAQKYCKESQLDLGDFIIKAMITQRAMERNEDRDVPNGPQTVPDLQHIWHLAFDSRRSQKGNCFTI